MPLYVFRDGQDIAMHALSVNNFAWISVVILYSLRKMVSC